MEKKNYAYLTKAGILKVVENPNTAMENAKGGFYYGKEKLRVLN
nr:MAG TPA: hypothetical protein [Caudoviricetes sp.]